MATSEAYTTVTREYADIQLNQDFHWADWVIFTAFLAVSLGIGLFQGLCVKQEKTAEAFHMGNRDFNIWPVALSLLSAFLSAILILGTPAEVYVAGTQYWIYTLGMMASCVFAVILFVPLMYPLKLTSSYEVHVFVCAHVFKTIKSPIVSNAYTLVYVHVSMCTWMYACVRA